MKKAELVEWLESQYDEPPADLSKMKKPELAKLAQAIEDGVCDTGKSNGTSGTNGDQRVVHLTGELEAAMKKIAQLEKNSTVAAAKFTLYIDCFPTKDEVGDPTLLATFEDWYGSIQERMNELVAEANEGVGSYWSLSFAQQKALISEVVGAACERSLPPAMVVSSSATGARDVLSILIPHADRVVRAIRG
jgi:hypothetical protein